MSADLPVNLALLPSWLDPEVILTSLGNWTLPIVALIIFAECGLLLGFFLPGDSLLFTAGLLVARDTITTPLWLICVLLTVCAFAGNVVGYYIGAKAGPTLFNKPDSKLFKQEHVVKTHAFFEKYGPRAIVLARFVPVVRTFITAIAGVAAMDKRKFFTYSALGAVLWATGLTILGFFLGQIDFIHDNLEAMLVLIVLISVIPIVIELVKARRERKRGVEHTL
ncbi:VTT domain-containing protein [Actinokineospora sp. NBRC 105648]|uniref:DedA family protein n=1 Tax=Actinokineospora sp. NBRC 105648 TaxID=3032206 RepID=UPI00255447A4|nr:VTT domain-containing protein [Actinokineospora sp. NBRC 105648]